MTDTYFDSYAEFLRFAHDFGLTSNLDITTIDIGDVYLSTIAVRTNGCLIDLRISSLYNAVWCSGIGNSYRDEEAQLCGILVVQNIQGEM